MRSPQAHFFKTHRLTTNAVLDQIHFSNKFPTMTESITHRFVFQLPVLHDENGRGYVSMAQEAENVYW